MSWCGARTARAGFKYPSFSLPYGTTIDAWVILSPHLRVGVGIPTVRDAYIYQY